MTTIHVPSFTAAEFAELHAITAELHGEWFPAWEGVDPADLPTAARTLSRLDQLVQLAMGRVI